MFLSNIARKDFQAVLSWLREDSALHPSGRFQIYATFHREKESHDPANPAKYLLRFQCSEKSANVAYFSPAYSGFRCGITAAISSPTPSPAIAPNGPKKNPAISTRVIFALSGGGVPSGTSDFGISLAGMIIRVMIFWPGIFGARTTSSM